MYSYITSFFCMISKKSVLAKVVYLRYRLIVVGSYIAWILWQQDLQVKIPDSVPVYLRALDVSVHLYVFQHLLLFSSLYNMNTNPTRIEGSLHYGYNWATAKAIATKNINQLCAYQIFSKHRYYLEIIVMTSTELYIACAKCRAVGRTQQVPFTTTGFL